jgi:hypothetical protein
MFGASTHNTDATMCRTMPTISGRRRPSESDSGPTISWPSASPASVPVKVSWATDDDTPNSSPMPGSAGRYMSMVSGPSATRAPRTRIIFTRRGGVESRCGVRVAGTGGLTRGDDAMQLVSTAYQYFLPGRDRDHRRAPAAAAVRCRPDSLDSHGSRTVRTRGGPE